MKPTTPSEKLQLPALPLPLPLPLPLMKAASQYLASSHISGSGRPLHSRVVVVVVVAVVVVVVMDVVVEVAVVVLVAVVVAVVVVVDVTVDDVQEPHRAAHDTRIGAGPMLIGRAHQMFWMYVSVSPG